MWVVKIGGSLLNSPYLSHWLSLIKLCGRGQVVLVPGGGVFADQVRKLQVRWQLDDITAHRMALRAMEQFGLICKNIEPDLVPVNSKSDIRTILKANHVPIWFPYEMVADNSEIAASWDITSDSLSLWLAEKLNCKNVVLIKSTLPASRDYSAKLLSLHGYLDQTFAKWLTKSCVKAIWLSHEQTDILSELLINKNDDYSLNTIINSD